MINGLHKILKDPQCAVNIRHTMWAAVVVCLYFSFMIYGLAILSSFAINYTQIQIEETDEKCAYYKFPDKGIYKVCE